MKTLSPAMQAHIEQPVTTLSTCWLLSRTDGVTFAYTDFNEILVIDGVSYNPVGSFTPTAIQTASLMQVDNLEMAVALDASSQAITQQDIRAGLYDFATVEIFMVNNQDLSMGTIPIRTGWIGEITINRASIRAEIRGLMQILQNQLGIQFSNACRANLGDTKCTVNLAPLTVTATVTQTTALNNFFVSSGLTQPVDYFTGGLVTFITGANAGFALQCKIYNPIGDVVVIEPFPYPIAVGDQFTIYPGCNKQLTTCLNKFNNLVNFRGEPFIPGVDAAVEYPNQH